MSLSPTFWKRAGIITGVIVVLLTIAKMAGWIGGDDSLKVSVEKISRRDIIETVSANGKVQPEVELKISADVSGEITELYVMEGQLVKKGTLLLRINPEIYLSSLDRMVAAVNGNKANLASSRSRLIQAEVQFEKSRQDFKRNESLFKDKVISDSEFDAARSAYEVAKAEVEAARQGVSSADFNVKSAEASLKEARENLNKTSIYATVDGTISKLSKEKGERVVGTNMMEGTEILRIANLNEMEVSVEVSETDIVRVSTGDSADIEIDAWLNRTFTGVVSEVANSSNLSSSLGSEQVTNYVVKVRILRESYMDLLEGKADNYSPFRPGMSATVDIRTRKEKAVLCIPIQSVTTRDTTVKAASEKWKKKDSEEKQSATTDVTAGPKPVECVFVVKEGKVQLRPVKTGIQDNLYIQILEGLSDSDEVVSGPYNAISRQLKNGQRVKIVPREELFEKDKK